jgi:phosphoserine phosphatase
VTTVALAVLDELRAREVVRRVLPAPSAGGGFVLVVDADRTLAPEDTGRLTGRALGVDDRIRSIFADLGYGPEAFEAVAGVWSEIPVRRYLDAVAAVTARVELRPAWRTILSETRGRVPVVVVTAGIPQAWRRVLTREGFGDVPVVGGCHDALDDHLVCPSSKAAIVQQLQEGGRSVVAAGDSRIDLPMLARAEIPVFVPDHKGSPGLRAELHRVPRVRQLVVDAQRFPELPACTADDLARLLLEGAAA